MPVQLTASASGRVVVVALIGEHDLATAEPLRRTLLELSSHVSLIVIDFDATEFMDSSVMGVLVGAAKRAARHGNRVIGVNARGIVLKAMAMTGVDALLQVPTTDVDLDQELSELLYRG